MYLTGSAQGGRWPSGRRQTGRSEAELIRAALDAAVAASAPAVTPVEPADPPLPGRLVGVGVGPGDADLLTVRAVAALRRADRVVAPVHRGRRRRAGRGDRAPGRPGPRRRAHPVRHEPGPRPTGTAPSPGPRPGRRATSTAGEEVAFITLGDPLTYSTFSAVAAGRPRAGGRRHGGRPRCPASWRSRPWPPGPGR